MAEEKKEKWITYLSGTTVLIAVCATLATFKGGSYGTKSILTQSKASDQWAYYQAKGIKQYLYEIQKENLQLELNKKDERNNEAEIEKLINNYDQKVKKYIDEKDQITAEAKKLEAVIDDCKLHQSTFAFAVIFLQVAILLSSIAALIKKKPIWYISLVLGVIGIVYFINGFFLFF